jgi:hypothetical protein
MAIFEQPAIFAIASAPRKRMLHAAGALPVTPDRLRVADCQFEKDLPAF